MTTGRPQRGGPLTICTGHQAQVPHQPVTYYGATCPVCERQARVDRLLEELATQRAKYDVRCAACPERAAH